MAQIGSVIQRSLFSTGTVPHPWQNPYVPPFSLNNLSINGVKPIPGNQQLASTLNLNAPSVGVGLIPQRNP
jgi:hypothetical protein